MIDWRIMEARGSDVNVPVHDRLEDGGEGGDAYPGANKHSVFRSVYVARGRSKWSVNVNLEKRDI